MTKIKFVLRRQNNKTLITEAAEGGENESHTGDVYISPVGDLSDLDPSGATVDLIPEDQQFHMAEEPDRLRKSIHRMSSRHWIARLIRGIVRATRKREIDPSVQRKRQEESKLRHQRRFLMEEADLYWDRIINTLNARDLCYRYPKSERDLLTSGIRSVNFTEVRLQSAQIGFKIDTVHRPRGIGILQLVAEDVLTDLSVSCGHRVTAMYNEKDGAWYWVERESGIRGIPSHVTWQEMTEVWPQYADELTIPMGRSANSKMIYRSLKTMPHLLIAGSTGAGKSNMMNVILCTLISRNTPDNLRLLGVDLKGGLELTFYEGIPHLMSLEDITETGIVYERDAVPGLLSWLIGEGERRMNILKEAGHKEFGKYNAHRKYNKLPRIVLLIDEWADIKLDPAVGRKAEPLLANLAARMRAVGIHVIVATQAPTKEVISTLIKTNLKSKMAFSCPSISSSMLILGNGDAKDLQPPGRFIYQSGEQITIQSPYISDQMVREIVQAAIEGRSMQIKQSHDVTLEEILCYALDNLDGELSHTKLYEQFKKRGLTRDETRTWMKSIENQVVVVRDTSYEVSIPSGSAPRRLKLVSDDVEIE
ncbi:MAG: FtsK/SpoIIIE domain-containing protein [Candidatus Bathyarchaeota archaeon]|nr:FtsK/SpoIIIE domain-containing protein [Candidatus Bathyarchaeota archaeon]